MNEILTAKQVGDRLKVSAQCVRKWYRRGRFPAYVYTTKDGGKTVRFDWTKVQEGLGMNKRVEETQDRLAERGV